MKDAGIIYGDDTSTQQVFVYKLFCAGLLITLKLSSVAGLVVVGIQPMGWGPTHGLGSNPWIGVQPMDWGPTHGLGSNPWIGVQPMDWGPTHGLGSNLWIGVQLMDWGPTHGLGSNSCMNNSDCNNNDCFTIKW